MKKRAKYKVKLVGGDYSYQAHRQGGFEGVRANPSFDLKNILYTVKPPNKGHFGDGPVVPCREVVLFSEVFF